MIRKIAKLEFKIEIVGTLLWLLVLSLILILFMFFFPFMQDSDIGTLLDNFNAFPPELMEAMQLNDMDSLLQLDGYFVYVFQYIFLAACIFTCILGGKSLIKEESDGVIEFLYSQPITRKNIIFGKLTGNLFLLVALWVGLFCSSVLCGVLFKSNSGEFNKFIHGITSVFLNQIIVLVLFYCIGLFFSSFLKSSQQAGGIAMGLVFGTYIIGLLSDIVNDFSWLRYLSPIKMAAPAILLKDNIDIYYLIVSVMMSILAVSGTGIIYKRKDFRLL